MTKSWMTKVTLHLNSKLGRPKINFAVALAEGRSSPHAKSRRAKLLAYVRTAGTRVLRSELEQKFGPSATGDIQKLVQVGWLTRVEP